MSLSPFVRRVLSVVALTFVADVASVPRLSAEEVTIELREPSGLARGGYPVSARLTLPRPAPRNAPFCLYDRSKPVVAQFRPAGDNTQAGETEMESEWWLDLTTALAPWEKRRLTLRYGAGQEPGPEGKGGHVLVETEKYFQVVNAPYITWSVPRDLAGLLHSIDFPPNEYLRPDSPGLVLRGRDGREHVLGTDFHAGRVVRSGRQAVALQFTGAAGDEALTGVRSTVHLTFPSPVSWVEVDWTIDDPHDHVAALGAALHLALDAPRPDAPTLVDFGAGTWVYDSLSAGETAEMQAAPAASPSTPSWRVLHGPKDRLVPLAESSADSGLADEGPAAEGWFHVMDRRRCLALAIDRFARDAAERISVKAAGDVSVQREYVGGDAPRVKRLHFWMHFVVYPPQYSAGASPRMMQTPPEAVIVPPAAGKESEP